jgi:hypothetical protein
VDVPPQPLTLTRWRPLGALGVIYVLIGVGFMSFPERGWVPEDVRTVAWIVTGALSIVTATTRRWSQLSLALMAFLVTERLVTLAYLNVTERGPYRLLMEGGSTWFLSVYYLPILLVNWVIAHLPSGCDTDRPGVS